MINLFFILIFFINLAFSASAAYLSNEIWTDIVKKSDPKSFAAIMAVNKQLYNIVRTLYTDDIMKYGPNICLIKAVEEDTLTIPQFKLLLEYNVDLKTKDGDINGLTPLRIALEKGHGDAFRILLKKNKCINGTYDFTPICTCKGCAFRMQTPLMHRSILRGHIHLVKILLEEKASIDTGDINCDGPLYFSKTHKRDEITQLLLDNGAKY